MPLNRRRFLSASALFAAGGLAASGLSACGVSPSGGNKPVGSRPAGGMPAGSTPSGIGSQPAVTVGFVPIACSAPLLAAHASGAFERRGLNIRLRKFAGWADLWTAYATGELDIAHMLSPMPLAANAGYTAATRPTQLAFTQNTNGQALTLSTRHLGHVHRPEDLRGMVLGIPFEYSVHALLLRDYLSAHGIDPVRDVELRLLRPPDMVAQLAVGTVDGFIGPEPFTHRAQAIGAGRCFVPTKQMWDGHPCCSIAVAADLAPDIREPLVAGLKEGAALAPHAGEQLAQEKYLNQPLKMIEPALTGRYTAWDGQEIVDPDMLRFGDPTSAAAITWMSVQLARWGLGGALEQAAHDARAILPPDADYSTAPLTINGRTFDPQQPTRNL